MLDPLDPRWQDIPIAAPAEMPSVDGTRASAVTPLGRIEISSLGRGAFRLRIGPRNAPGYGILVDEPEAVGSAEVRADAIEVAEGNDRLRIDLATGAIALARNVDVVAESATDGHFVRSRRLPTLGRTDDGWIVSFALTSGERVYGIGEKWGPLDKRGLLVDCWTEDALGVNAEKAYKNSPFGWTTGGWGLFVHTPGRVRNGVGYPHWSHRSWVVEVLDEALDLFLFLGSGAEVIGRYTELTGRMAPPPLWSLGSWISRAYYRTPAEAIDAAKEMRDRNLPADVILIDGRAWQDTDTRFTFDWDRSRWPDPKAEIDRLHALGFKVVCWEYPLVSVRNPLFAELEAKDYFLKDARTGKSLLYEWDTEPFGKVLTPLPESAILDFTNEDAAQWWRDRHRLAFDAGVDAMKPDFGEQVPDDALASNGDTGRRLHNVYPLLYNRTAWEATRAAHGDDALLFTRAGWAGSQRYPMQWGGDPQSDWEGMAASLRGGMSWGLSGAPAHATDIGGFYGHQPNAELFLRWTAMAVFQSHMRFHGIGPREPYAFGHEAEAIARAWLELRYRLLPYIAGTVELACRTGLPCQRPMVLAFPEDPSVWGFEEQFMLGPDLFVAPVLKTGGRVRYRVPAGRWRDFWSGAEVEGNQTVDAELPLDRIPLLVCDGAQIALGPVVAHTGELAGRLRIEELRQYGTPLRAPVLPQAWDAGGVRTIRMDLNETTAAGGA